MSRVAKNIFKNTAIGFILFLLNIVQNLLLIPLFLKYWGNTKYSFWLIVFSSFSLMQFFDIGHKTFLGYQINLEFKNSRERCKMVLDSGLFYSMLLAFLPILLMFILKFSGSIQLLLPISSAAIDSNNLFWALVVFQVVYMLFSVTSGIVVAILYPIDKLFASQVFELCTRLFTIAVLVLSLVLNFSVFTTVAMYSLVQIIFGGLIIFYIYRQAPFFFPLLNRVSLKLGFVNLVKSLSLTVNSVITQSINFGTNLLVSGSFGSASLPTFTTTKTIGNTGGFLSSIITRATILELLSFFHQKKLSQWYAVIKVNWFVTNVVYNGVILIFSPFLIDFYVLWTQKQVHVDRGLLYGFLIGNSMISIGFVLNQFIAANNILKPQNVINIVRFVSFFLFALICQPYLGLAAFGLAFVLAELLASIVLPVYFVNDLLRREGFEEIPVITIIKFAIPSFLLILYLSMDLFQGYSQLMYILFIVIFISNVVYLFFQLDEAVVGRFREMVKRKQHGA